MTRIPTPPLPDENEIETKVVEVIKEVTVEKPVPAPVNDSVLQILAELRDNMFAMSQHLQQQQPHKSPKSLPDIPDFAATAEDVSGSVTPLIKTDAEPSKTLP